MQNHTTKSDFLLFDLCDLLAVKVSNAFDNLINIKLVQQQLISAIYTITDHGDWQFPFIPINLGTNYC